MQLRSACSFLLLLGLFSALHAQRTIYVSPTTGDDANPGSTAEAPLASLTAAQSRARELSAGGSSVTVNLLPGTYVLDAPLRFDQRDGGQGGEATVEYRALRPGTVTLSGGRTVPAAAARTENGLLVLDLRAAPFRQLYVNDRRATRSRHPNGSDTYLETAGWDFDNRTLFLPGNHAGMLADAPDAEALVLMSWAEAYLRIQRAAVKGVGAKFTTLTFADEEAEILFNRPWPAHKASHSLAFENALAFVDSPGEWYHDPRAEKLYYYPRAGESAAELTFTIPVLDTLISVRGTAEEPVHNLTISGLHLRYSNWAHPSAHGHLNAQAGMYNYRSTPENDQYVHRPPAAVYVTYAEGFRIADSDLRQLGSVGVDLHYGTRHCAVEGNTFTDIAGAAVMVARVVPSDDTEMHVPYLPDDERDVSRGDRVASNLIDGVATVYFGSPGIVAGYPRELRIEHNVIRHLPYSGISLGWGWTGDSSAMRDNLVAYNEIYDVVRLLNDGGGIYTLSYQPGTRLYRNYIHDIPKPTHLGQKLVFGVYLDEQSGGSLTRPLTLEENIITRDVPDRINFHKPGYVLVVNTAHSPTERNAPDYFEQIGIQTDPSE